MMIHCAVLVLALTLGFETQLTRATVVSVNNTEGELCLFANLTVIFDVTYEAIGDKNKTAVFTLPDDVVATGSSCDNSSATLKLGFGSGHSWALSFSKGLSTYQADNITFDYNLTDSSLFPNATSNETLSVSVSLKGWKLKLDTCYSCKSPDLIREGAVNQTLLNVLVQAFVANGSKSAEITSCAADVPVTTPAAPTTPTPQNTTTPVAPTTTAPSPPLPTPPTGNYNVTTGEVNGTICLMATLGLRVSFLDGEKLQEINLEDNGTIATGICGVNSSSELVLSNAAMTLRFTFVNETTQNGNKFHLHAVNVAINTSSGTVFTDGNDNLTLWAASVGSSYMCNTQQSYNITNSLIFHTFALQIQPFDITKGKFSTAHECSMDDSSLLIPIIVGVSLAVLILIVLIAYVIGRRKTYVGYQTL